MSAFGKWKYRCGWSKRGASQSSICSYRVEHSGLDLQELRSWQCAETMGYRVEAGFPDDVSGRSEFMKRNGFGGGERRILEPEQGRDRGPGFRPPHRRRERSELP